MDRLHNFGFLIKDVSRLSGLNFERHAVELNMTLTQCKVLAHLQRNAGITQVQLAELSDIDQMTLVRLLDRMEAENWVARSPHPTDRRARCLTLRPAAAPVLQRMWRLADRARAAALTGLSIAEKDQLMSLLERVHANLSALTADVGADSEEDVDDESRGDRKSGDKVQRRKPVSASLKRRVKA